MRFFSRKTAASGVTEKSCDTSWADILAIRGGSFLQYLYANDQTNLSFPVLSAYYRLCPVVADAVDRIAKEFAAVQPKIFDKQKGEFVDTDFLDCLESPNVSMSKHQFLGNYAATYLIFGNTFLYASGISKIQEISYIEPQYLNLRGNYLNLLTDILVTKGSYSQAFVLDETNGQAFYVNDTKTQKGKMLRAYNPNSNQSNLYGISRLAAISYDIEQFLAASRHNLSLLANGTTPSGIVTFEGGLPDQENEARLKAQMRAWQTGAVNAGKTLFLPSGMQFQTVDQTVDSDFQVLRQNVEATIYRRLEIPSALVTTTAMTLNNLEVAQLMLYDNAVIPLIKTLYKPLQDLIFSYLKIDDSRYVMTYDENEISALALRKTQLIQQKAGTNAYTANEIRSWYGDERLTTGGDDIYVLTTQVPAGDNAYVAPAAPTTPDPVDDDE